MKATVKFYAKPDKGQTTEVVPVVSVSHDWQKPDDRGINLRLMAVGEGSPSGEFNVRMSAFEALSLAAEIVLKVARRQV